MPTAKVVVKLPVETKIKVFQEVKRSQAWIPRYLEHGYYEAFVGVEDSSSFLFDLCRGLEGGELYAVTVFEFLGRIAPGVELGFVWAVAHESGSL